MIYICNLISNDGFSETEMGFDEPPLVGSVVRPPSKEGQWKITDVYEHEQELWLRKIETGGPPK